jgi:hypothetical protein
MRHFAFDPFAHRSRRECTVGALRATAADVDITVRAANRPAATKMTKASDLTRRPGTDRPAS